MNAKDNQVPESMTLYLVDRRESTFVLEGTEHTEMPIVRNAPAKYRLPSESVMVVEGENVRIRYIENEKEIIKEVQDKKGLKPNPATDTIWFTDGFLTVTRQGAHIGLYDYLKKCSFNASNKDRPTNVPAIFEEYNSQEVVKAMLERDYNIGQAKKIINGLYRKEKGQFVFETDRVTMLARLFNLSPDRPEEVILHLQAIAEKDPERIIKGVADKTNEIKANILHAIDMNVIGIDGENAVLTSADNKVFKTFDSEKKDDKIDELINFFMGDEGDGHYRVILIDLNAAKQKAVAAQ